MIVYRDKTFCTAKCSNEDCSRKFTEKVKADAKEFGLEIFSLADFTHNCDQIIYRSSDSE